MNSILKLSLILVLFVSFQSHGQRSGVIVEQGKIKVDSVISIIVVFPNQMTTNNPEVIPFKNEKLGATKSGSLVTYKKSASNNATHIWPICYGPGLLEITDSAGPEIGVIKIESTSGIQFSGKILTIKKNWNWITKHGMTSSIVTIKTTSKLTPGCLVEVRGKKVTEIECP